MNRPVSERHKHPNGRCYAKGLRVDVGAEEELEVVKIQLKSHTAISWLREEQKPRRG